MNSLNTLEKIILSMLIIIFLLVIGYTAEAGGKYHITKVTNITEVQTSIYDQKGIAVAIASAQHHYKAGNFLQWSVGAGYINDDSAVSFGLGKQVGKVFISGNFSSDGTTSAVGIGASGTF